MSAEKQPVARPELVDMLREEDYAICLTENIMDFFGKGRSDSKALSREAHWDTATEERCHLRSCLRTTKIISKPVLTYELKVHYSSSNRIKEMYRFSSLATTIIQYDENEKKTNELNPQEKSHRLITYLLASGFTFNPDNDPAFFEIAAYYHLDTERIRDIQQRLGYQGIFGANGCLDDMTQRIQEQEPLVVKTDVAKATLSYLNSVA